MSTDGLVGQELAGKYRILEKIGAGGMSTIYRAEHRFLRKAVAVKVLRREIASDPDTVQRFFKEAENNAKVDHPNVVKVFDFGNADGQLFLVMQLMEGTTLDKVLRERGVFPPDRAVYIILQILSGVAYAHNRRLIHRDIKPANIGLTPASKAYILDFGIAVLRSMAVARSNLAPGTPDYMSPEQLRGRADERSDLYSVGVTLFELLTGHVPFRGENIVELQLKIMKDPPPSLRQERPEVPAVLDDILQKAMRKTPSERYQSAHEFARALLSLGMTGPPAGFSVEEPSRGGGVEAAEQSAPPPQKAAEPPRPKSDDRAQKAEAGLSAAAGVDTSITQFIPILKEPVLKVRESPKPGQYTRGLFEYENPVLSAEVAWRTDDQAYSPWPIVLPIFLLVGLITAVWLILAGGL